MDRYSEWRWQMQDADIDPDTGLAFWDSEPEKPDDKPYLYPINQG